ncbi:type IV pilin biogenesis protein, putative [Shewanella denitrificans OS217]|uniref:Type IV pilin biogenesis protein, putative n=1 Tax=Shewanella denitrificans (strain OS217 / ATCC BAA-1090 / DSM 15013) TaxID=318161 RepID=Q12KN1_SHEDO|nr:PilC/PilY family type IV pilus protein [Shewanella denitrificans]ABE55995.1 type IV pilin biogenesis protein, putative [Shewanella denitrificans OS217]
MLTRICGFSVFFAVLMGAATSHADDTELYVFESSSRSGARPQVMIIFDNSGSMRTVEPDATAFYDPNVIYPAVGSGNALQERMVYFTKGGIDNTAMPVPDSPSESRRFLSDINGCETSWNYLNTYGVFTGFFREYSFSGQNGTWQEVPDNNGANVTVIDCFDDIEAKKWKNAPGQPTGFPVDSAGNKQNPIRYTPISASSTQAQIDAAIIKAKQTGFGTGKALTLYTDNYLRWYHGDQANVPKSRLDIAKEVIKNTIVTTPSVDFGLTVFNINAFSEGDADGGRIVSGIKTMTEANKLALLNTVAGLDPETNTPLCETLYEVQQYFGGKTLTFGNKDKKPSGYSYTPNTPPRDTSIEQSGKYISPFKECQNLAYVVYITDGVPTLDQNANNLVKALPNADQTAYKNTNPNFSSYLPNLAQWMNNNDVNANLVGEQKVKTFTIGFSDGAADAAPLLIKTAELGGGKYFAAKGAAQLQAALQQVFTDILEVNASFTSPSIASNNFDRTETFDSVYYAMFLPNRGPRWSGNLKKFKVTSGGKIIDSKSVEAIGSDGNIKSSACSFWTSSAICASSSDGGDGNDVTIGGTAEALRQTANRKILSNLSGGLVSLTKSAAATVAGGNANLATYIGVDETSLDAHFDWLKGADVDDDNANNNRTENRRDIMGDPLHSKPLALNFGSESTPDIRVILGTNHGFLHMFKDAGTTVTESWAFMPYELLPNIRPLKANVPSGVHSVYGMDSSPVAYVKRSASGSIEKAWLFVGMRRGGKSYYAIDITNPDNPSFMWKVDANSAGMSELGQTWAKPVIAFIPGWPTGNADAGSAKPVLIVGAGYSPATKDGAAVGTDDSNGRGAFVLDAETGALVHAFGTSSGSNATKLPGITDSVPNSVALLDSNNDRLTDRIYLTDTGANVWRIDMPSANPSDSTRPWTAFKFASLGGSSVATDRRFFAEATVAKTVFTNIAQVTTTDAQGQSTTVISHQNIPYDAVVIGSGNRPHPSDKGRTDMFFTLQDRNVSSKSFNGTTGNEIPVVLTKDDLYDVTSAPPVGEAQNLAFGAKRGWYYAFGSLGEKSLSAAAIIRGRVFFTSYVPGDSSSSNQCLVAGVGRLYGFDLHKGTRSYTQTYFEMGERVPDTPQLVIPPGGKKYMYLIGIGDAGDDMVKKDPDPEDDPEDCVENCVGDGLQTNKIYYHVSE